MCDLICDVITYCVGKINVSDEIMFENQKKNMETKEILT